MVIDILSADDFQQQVLEASHNLPVLAEFWAGWCDPCHILTPILTELAEEGQGQHWVLAKIDSEALPEVAAQFHIRSVPAIRIFRNGQIVASFNGLMWKKDMARWIQQAIEQ